MRNPLAGTLLRGLFILFLALTELAVQGATLTVTNLSSSGKGTLSQAILDANTNANQDTIVFNVTGAGIKTINLTGALPPVLYPVTIDGTTQPGYAGKPLIELNGAGAGAAYGIELHSGSNIVKGLCINRFSFAGMVLLTNGNNRLEANFVGTDPGGTLPRPNGTPSISDGITIIDSPNNTVISNLLSGNARYGIALVGEYSKSNVVAGNLIGTDYTGAAAIANRDGLNVINGANNIIGGTNASARNVISGNAEDGVEMGAYATGNLVIGNYIGLSASGTAQLGNGANGMLITTFGTLPGTPVSNVIGASLSPNYITANGKDGIQLAFGTSENRISGNVIGLDASMHLIIGNGRHGVAIYDSTNNLIGGNYHLGEGNIISGNRSNGVYIGMGAGTSGSQSNRVQGNQVGTQGGNGALGIHVKGGSGNLIGGLEEYEKNWIAYNGTNLLKHGHGVVIEVGTNNAILGNSIWANAGRGIDLGNDSFDINDYDDDDEGPNRRMNYPVVTAVSFDPITGTHDITWTLKPKLDINSHYRVEFFSNSELDPSGFGEAETLLGYTNLVYDNLDGMVFTRSFGPSEQKISVTATHLEENNTSELSPIDTDGDGIPDAWEEYAGPADTNGDGFPDGWITRGIDVNEDGIIDLVLTNATPFHKDVFVEVDAMTGLAPSMANLNRARIGTTDLITGLSNGDGFNNAPNYLVQNPDGRNGVNVHIELDETDVPYEQSFNEGQAWSRFQALRASYFGSLEQVLSTNALAAKKLVYRYCLFADAFQDISNGLKGRSDGANGICLWLGQQGAEPYDQYVPTAFMHELGHCLGLEHGGVDDINTKPNYHSVMNYFWTQFYWFTPGTVMDYAREDRMTLNESSLNEQLGAAGTPLHANHYVVAGPRTVNGKPVPLERMIVPEFGPIDWNYNGTTNDTVARDITSIFQMDFPVRGEPLISSNDWSRLEYYFLEKYGFSHQLAPAEDANDLPNSVLQDLQSIGSGVGVLQFSQPEYTIAETNLFAFLTVTRTLETTGAVSVSFFTQNGTAASDVDYRSTNGILTFVGGETIKTFSISIINDSLAEKPESFRVILTNATGGAKLGPFKQAVVHILDDDSPPHFTVINTNNSGPGSFQQAIFDANEAPGIATIDFNIPASSGLTISPNALLIVRNSVTIDGATQPGYAGKPIIEISGASAGGSDGIWLYAGQSKLRGLIINRFNGSAIQILNTAQGTVENCYIGLSRQGTTNMGNYYGILLGSPGNVIGGASPLTRNYISGNQAAGIIVSSSSNTIAGNVIGLGVDGSPQGNRWEGIQVTGPDNTIGGLELNEGNIISGNKRDGLYVGSTRNLIQGNRIGTDLSGTGALGNGSNGITIAFANSNVLGGVNAEAGNVLSGNLRNGLELRNASGTLILGNWIGAAVDGATAIPNQFGGILLDRTCLSNQIGNDSSRAGNTIAFNKGAAVYLLDSSARNNSIRGNAIYSNVGGIDLGGDGPTPNDLLDADTGPNQFQNYPVLTGISNVENGFYVFGTFNSAPNTNFILDFYLNTAPDTANAGYGEGRYWVGATNVVTGSDGRISFTFFSSLVRRPGNYLTATATDLAGNTSEFSYNLPISSTFTGRTFTVITADDSGLGSLRQAILDSNQYNSQQNTIQFNIPGGGVKTIHLLSALPNLVVPVLIDGYSQPGARANTSSNAFNGLLLIELDGSQASANEGIVVDAGNCVIRGLVINRFGIDNGRTSTALVLRGPAGQNRIEGNLFGTDPTGKFDRGNLFQTIRVYASSDNVIGGTLPAARNVISATKLLTTGLGVYESGDAIVLSIPASGIQTTPRGNRIEGNLIGTKADGFTPLGNDGFAVRFNQPGSNTVIGGTAPGTGNVIAFNGSTNYPFIGGGIDDPVAWEFGGGNSILGNSIYSNVVMGIKGNQVNARSGVGNFPFLGSALVSNGVLRLQGRLNGLSNNTHRIEFFANNTFDRVNGIQGRQFLGWTNAVTDSNGFAAFTGVLPASLTNGTYVTSTATDQYGNTSEFSPRLAVGDVLTNVYVVNTGDDVDNGKATAAHTSLREAIVSANNHPGQDTIRFAVPTGFPPTNPTIGVTNAFPAIMDTITLDGTTQSGYAGKPILYLDGNLSANTCFRLYSLSNIVRGFAIDRFNICIYGDGDFSGSGSGRNIIDGNYIGAGRNGNTNGGANYGISLRNGCSDNRIGGSTAAARNVISGNNYAGLQLLESDGQIIHGNYIGLDATGTNELSNGRGFQPVGGIYIFSCNGLTIGGTTPAERNFFGRNNYYDMYMEHCSSNTVQGNFFGTGITGSNTFGQGTALNIDSGNYNIIRSNLVSGYYSAGINLGYGVNHSQIEGNWFGTDAGGKKPVGYNINALQVLGGDNVVGGTTPGSRNVIANGGFGLVVGCCNNRVQGNLIGTGIDGQTPLGMIADAIQIKGSSNLIGGTVAGAANVIAYSGGSGIAVINGTNNALLGNSIFLNTGLGIDLDTPGILPNDLFDTDSGANNLQNFPVLSSARNTGAGTVIQGTFNGLSNGTFRIEFFSNTNCHPSGNGQGKTFVTAANLTTTSSGTNAFTLNLPLLVGPGLVLTATATDPANNTSEFSPCVTVINDTNYVILSLSVAGKTNILSWPTWASGYLLQTATNLAPPVSWQSVSNGIVTNSGYKVFTTTNNPASPTRFYRLLRP